MLYAFGSNGSGQLGVGHEDDISAPEKSVALLQPDVGQPISHLAAGGNHTVVVTKDGRLLACGDNEQNQICTSMDSPSARMIAATWTTSTIIDDNNMIYSCGEGPNGELGHSKGVLQSPDHLMKQSLPSSSEGRIIQLASCMAHTVVVLDSGEVYGWGNGRKGQLGEPAEIVGNSRKFEGVNFHATKAVCGKDFTCIIGKNGELLVFGLNSRDRFGVKSNAPSSVPADLKDIVASWGSIFMLKHNGEIRGWGRDDHGQLPPLNLPQIEAIAAGSEHCLALTKAGEVLAWGWGEHGNCGQPTDEKGDVKGHWNTIAVPGNVSRVFAGCATSFIETVGE